MSTVGSSVAAPAQISTDHPALATGLVSAGVAAAGLVAATLTVWAVHRSPVLVDAHNAAILRGLFVASYGGIGIYTWRRRPASRLGPLFIGVGFLYALLTLNASSEPLPNTIGRALLGAPIVAVVYLLVCFPRDRLATASDRRFMTAFAAASAVTWALALTLTDKLSLAGPFSDCGDRCPDNALRLVSPSAPVTGVVRFLVNATTVLGVAWTICLWFARRARHRACAGAPGRRF